MSVKHIFLASFALLQGSVYANHPPSSHPYFFSSSSSSSSELSIQFPPPPSSSLVVSKRSSFPFPLSPSSSSHTSSSAAQISHLQKRSSENICGNGLVDPGEECDYKMPHATECCSASCKLLPDIRTLCTRDKTEGVCKQGICQTRQSQCSAFDNHVLATGSVSLTGPFSACHSADQSKKDLQCRLSCSGRNQSNDTDVCLDLKMYANVNNLVTDGLGCGDTAEKDSPAGICIHGQCRQDVCRKARCNNRGPCLRVSDSSIQCKCDAPYSGSQCQLMSGCDGVVDYCGVCNGNNSTCYSDFLSDEINPSYASSTTFKIIVLPAICVTSLLFLVVVGYVVHRVRNPPSQTSNSQAFLGKFLPKSGPPSKFGISVRWDEFRCILAYEPQMPDELELAVSDIVFKLFEYDDGWAKGYNTRTQREGVYPVSFTEKVGKVNTSSVIAEEN